MGEGACLGLQLHQAGWGVEEAGCETRQPRWYPAPREGVWEPHLAGWPEPLERPRGQTYTGKGVARPTKASVWSGQVRGLTGSRQASPQHIKMLVCEWQTRNLMLRLWGPGHPTPTVHY